MARRIRSLDVRRVSRELVTPLVTATGVHASRTASLVRVVLSDGSVGWGENVAPEGGFYTGESAEASSRHLADVLIPRLDGATVPDPGAIEALLGDDEFPMARHAVTSAVWDAWCRAEGISLAEALGGSLHPVEACAVIGLADSPDIVARACVRAAGEGYRHLKLKIAPGRDVEVVAAVREAVGETVSVSVDANGTYSAGHVGVLAGLGRYGVGLVEQPFAADDIGSHAALVSAGGVGVGLDESVMSPDDLRRAIDARACTAVNIKPARVGGFATAVAMAALCRDAGVDAWVGGMLESGVGRAGALALASHPAFSLPTDLSASARYFIRDVTEPFVLSDGCLSPRGPGIGVEPLPDPMGWHQ